MMSIDHELFPTKKGEGRNYPFGDARGGGLTCERLESCFTFSLTRALERGGGRFCPPLMFFCEYLSKYSFDRLDFFQYLPKNKRRTFWCKN